MLNCIVRRTNESILEKKKNNILIIIKADYTITFVKKNVATCNRSAWKMGTMQKILMAVSNEESKSGEHPL